MFSRQFRALVRLSLLWIIPWTLCGIVVAFASWHPSLDATQAHLTFAQWLFVHAFMYASLGAVSGLTAGLAMARLERGKPVAVLARGRAFLWGMAGGSLPLVLFGACVAVFGITNTALLPIVALGIVSALLSGGVAVGALEAARLGDERPYPEVSNGMSSASSGN